MTTVFRALVRTAIAKPVIKVKNALSTEHKKIVELEAQLANEKLRSEKAIGHLNERKSQLAHETARAEKAIGHLNARKKELAQQTARAEKAIGHLNERKRQVENLKSKNTKHQKLEATLKTEIENCIRKMWGGYAREGFDELKKYAEKPFTPNNLRAFAYYELARFCAESRQLHTAIRFLSDSRRQSKQFARSVRFKVLEIDLLLKIKDFDRAKELLETNAELRPDDPNFKVGKCNYHLMTDDLPQAIASLNSIFEPAKMSQIKIADPENPFLSIESADSPYTVHDTEKVSILMSNHNSEKYLKVAIESMLNQTWRNIELIITDDCSTDGGRDVIAEYAKKDPRVIYYQNETNMGTYRNRNNMLKICTGDYITVHDSDDWSHPQMVEHQVRHLQKNPDIRVNTTLMCRVDLSLMFSTRPSRVGLEYCHMNYPGFMMRSADVRRLGGWDPIMANADAEFERRAKLLFGKSAFEIINPNQVYSFFLMHSNSLTQDKKMSLRSLTFGSRNEYHAQSKYWLNQQQDRCETIEDLEQAIKIQDRSAHAEPFPSPNALLTPNIKRSVINCDVLLVTDLNLLGGTRSCNINYVKSLNGLGKKVCLFNWPRADLKLNDDINPAYRDLAAAGLVEIVTWEDSIKAKRVLIHHPPILNSALDSFPTVETESASILVNQLPFQTTDKTDLFYVPEAVVESVKELLNVDTMNWISISPLAHSYLQNASNSIEVASEIWYPPLFESPEANPELIEQRFKRISAGKPKFARHARDHWTKWPISQSRARTLYLADHEIDLSILGGGRNIGNALRGIPDTWTIHEFDSVSVQEFLANSDIYLNFNNEIYIEEFGRNVMEAMAFGLPVIADPVFAKTFGSAVMACPDEGPSELIDTLIHDKEFFLQQISLGYDFVKENCSNKVVEERLSAFLSD